MSKTTARFLAIAAVLALGACVREPFPPSYYATPAPPPLQPYLGPPIAAAPAPVKRIVKRRYVRKRYHRRAHCRCVPVR